MFELEEIENLLDPIEKRDNILFDSSKLNIGNKDYVSFILAYKGCEITPDINIFGYEQALEANKYIAKEYPEIAKKIWQIGCSGSGDQWFLDKDSYSILFFDHDQGEYTKSGFIDLYISFYDFLRMAFLLHSLEYYLDKNNSFNQKKIEQNLRSEMNKLNTKLFDNYPYNFDLGV